MTVNDNGAQIRTAMRSETAAVAVLTCAGLMVGGIRPASGQQDSAPGAVYSLAASPDGIYAAGWFDHAGQISAPGVVLWTGTEFRSVSPPDSVTPANVFVVDNEVYLSGSNYHDHFYRWQAFQLRDTSWQRIGTFRHPCCSLPSVESISALSDGTLVVGGDFTSVDGVPVNSLAVLDSTGWDSLASVSGQGVFDEVLDRVFAIRRYGDSTYVGGDFNGIDRTPANKVALYDGSSWTALGGGLGNPPYHTHRVHDLLVVDESLYAAGRFDSTGSTRLNNVGRWTGDAWVPLGDGLGVTGYTIVYALASTPDGLIYAAGQFTDSTGTALGLAAWDGNAWNPVGEFRGGVHSMVVDSVGRLFIGGHFDSIGPTSVNGIAMWDGTSWHALDGGVTVATGTGTEIQDQSETELAIYPNPFVADFTVELPSPAFTGEDLVLFDILGRRVLAARIHDRRQRIDTADLAPGVYIVSVGRGGRQRSTMVVKSGRN